MDRKKKILLLAGAGIIGLFIIIRSISTIPEATGTQLSKTPLTLTTYPSKKETTTTTETSGTPETPSITYNLPSFPDPNFPTIPQSPITEPWWVTTTTPPSSTKKESSTYPLMEIPQEYEKGISSGMYINKAKLFKDVSYATLDKLIAGSKKGG